MSAAEGLGLQIPAKGERHRCRIIWRSELEIGIAFADAPTACEIETIAERMKRQKPALWDAFFKLRSLAGAAKSRVSHRA